MTSNSVDSGTRDLTNREFAALQTFPLWHDFGFNQPKRDVLKQIGNAYPPVVAQTVFESIIRTLEEEDGPLPNEAIRARATDTAITISDDEERELEYVEVVDDSGSENDSTVVLHSNGPSTANSPSSADELELDGDVEMDGSTLVAGGDEEDEYEDEIETNPSSPPDPAPPTFCSVGTQDSPIKLDGDYEHEDDDMEDAHVFVVG